MEKEVKRRGVGCVWGGGGGEGGGGGGGGRGLKHGDKNERVGG